MASSIWPNPQPRYYHNIDPFGIIPIEGNQIVGNQMDMMSAYNCQMQQQQIDNRYYPKTAEEQEIIYQMVGGPCVLFYDYQRDGIIADTFDKGSVFVSFSDIKRAMDSLRRGREMRYAPKSYNVDIPPLPKAENPQCKSCGAKHKVQKLDTFGRCPDRMLKLWDNIHKLYWHRYSKNKTK